METTVRSTKSLKAFNDWKYLLKIPKASKEPCANCCQKCAQRSHYGLPLASLKDELNVLNGSFLIANANSKRKPIHFYHTIPHKHQLLIKFTGDENYDETIKLVGNHAKEKQPATIISPNNLNRNTLQKEQKLVKLTGKYFEPLGFIKLHLHSVNEFHDYAENKDINLLILPMKDLPDYLQYALNADSIEYIVPAIFQPDPIADSHSKA